MTHDSSRRRFLEGAALGLGAAGLDGVASASAQGGSAPRRAKPVVIASGNGVAAVSKAMQVLKSGGDTLDAVIAGVNIVELDPNDRSVGYGGLPNESGDVELDASVMHGPTRRAGAVAALRGVRTPSLVAKAVLERTDHILIVGQGARDFATAQGFENVPLLTEESRIAWLVWKENLSPTDKWGPSPLMPAPASPAGAKKLAEAMRRPSWELANAHANGDPAERDALLAWADHVARNPPTGTINCLALDANDDLSGVTTTSGLAWKIPGRVGDSPLVGCGLYVDNDVGGAGSTGRGEEVIFINGSRTVVEYMKRGMGPEQAALEALKLVAARYGNDRAKLEQIDVHFYAVNKKGEYGGAAIWSHYNGPKGERVRNSFAVDDGGGGRLVEVAYLFESRS